VRQTLTRCAICGNRDATIPTAVRTVPGASFGRGPEEAMTAQDRVKHGTRLPISPWGRDASDGVHARHGLDVGGVAGVDR
jgi:hypothetical protein